MISVVIPLYNKEAYVKKALDTVVSQTYQNIEILVINDGSTDASEAIVKAYSDARIQVITTQNQGAAAARNVGINKASHPYIAFLDADDWWESTYLAEIVAAISTHIQQKIFATGRIHVFENKQVEYRHRLLPNKGETALVNHFAVIAKYLPAMHSSNVVIERQHLQTSGGFNEGMQHFEDHECWLRLAVNQAIVFVNKPLSFYNKVVRNGLSGNAVAFTDLITYYSTMAAVRDRLPGKEAKDFKLFYTRFVAWSYLKYGNAYAPEEVARLQDSALKLVSRREVKILTFLNKTGIASLYQFAKKLLDGNK